MNAVVKIENLRELIIELRGQNVLLDADVAEIYGVETKRINEAVKNNPDKFPPGYIIELNKAKWDELRSKFSTSKKAEKLSCQQPSPQNAKMPDLSPNMILSEVVGGPSLTILYGPSGSGKTRLFRHIEAFLHNRPERRVLRCCTSNLIDRLLDSLKRGTYQQFLSSLRAYRVLLIDNIWILGCRANTAKEIFRIFRMLIQRGGAVVIASDLEPSVISSWSKEIGEMIRQSRIVKVGFRQNDQRQDLTPPKNPNPQNLTLAKRREAWNQKKSPERSR